MVVKIVLSSTKGLLLITLSNLKDIEYERIRQLNELHVICDNLINISKRRYEALETIKDAIDMEPEIPLESDLKETNDPFTELECGMRTPLNGKLL